MESLPEKKDEEVDVTLPPLTLRNENEEEEEEEEHEEEAVDTAEPELVEEGKPCTSTAYSSSDDNERERDVGSHHNYWHPSNQTPPTLPPSRPTII